MAELLLLIIGVAVLLYAVLGGADFGAGMIEPFLPKADRRFVDTAISPVWEANHVWLILVIVMGFVGFPNAYAITMTALHIPISVALIGIVLRGCAFTFRHYDPNPGNLRAIYAWTFRLGSVIAPLFLGITAGALLGGNLITKAGADQGFIEVYVMPWIQPFPIFVGAFACSLFAFGAAALLAAESPREATGLRYTKLAQRIHALSVILGASVFAIAYLNDMRWVHAFLESPAALAALIIATLLIPFIATTFRRGWKHWLRLAVGAQLACILFGVAFAQAPILLRFADAPDLSIQAAAAPDATLLQLLIAVGVGLILIVPGMAYLLVVYKPNPK